MSNVVLYRKYRPSNFDEIIGQEHVVQTIQNAVAKNSVAHAYLFAGPRGTGKTTIARLVAKAINCLKAKNGNPRTERAEQSSYDGAPCGECQNCLDISEGRALDIIEIDAASNRGIDDIRELREGIRSSPAHLKYKVYIIDEAHQLTKEAFNALLKTLEEPPEHAVFVLATTSADKMPATILSRVQRFDFKKFSVAQIVEKLERIAKKEKVSADEDALRMIAYSAEGGLRDAESLFAQVMSRADAKVTEKTVREMLGIASPKHLSDFVDILAEKNLSRAISYLNKFHNDGGSPEEFLKALVNYLRELMLVKIDSALRSAVAPELTDEQFSVMIAQSKRFEQADLSAILIALMEAQDNLKKTSQPLLPVELALMKMLWK